MAQLASVGDLTESTKSFCPFGEEDAEVGPHKSEQQKAKKPGSCWPICPLLAESADEAELHARYFEAYGRVACPDLADCSGPPWRPLAFTLPNFFLVWDTPSRCRLHFSACVCSLEIISFMLFWHPLKWITIGSPTWRAFMQGGESHPAGDLMYLIATLLSEWSSMWQCLRTHEKNLRVNFEFSSSRLMYCMRNTCWSSTCLPFVVPPEELFVQGRRLCFALVMDVSDHHSVAQTDQHVAGYLIGYKEFIKVAQMIPLRSHPQFQLVMRQSHTGTLSFPLFFFFFLPSSSFTPFSFWTFPLCLPFSVSSLTQLVIYCTTAVGQRSNCVVWRQFLAFGDLWKECRKAIFSDFTPFESRSLIPVVEFAFKCCTRKYIFMGGRAGWLYLFLCCTLEHTALLHTMLK